MRFQATMGALCVWALLGCAGELEPLASESRAASVVAKGVTDPDLALGAHQLGCARDNEGIYCWGGIKKRAPFRISSPIARNAPFAVGDYVCGADGAGRTVCSRPTESDAQTISLPFQALAPDERAQYALRGDTLCLLRESGTVACASVKGEPAMHTLDEGVTQLLSGDLETCTVHSTSLRCTGAGAPTVLDFGAPIMQATRGYTHACALTEESSPRVLCMGANARGELGDATRSEHGDPREVTQARGAVLVTVGTNFSCALTRAGQAICWGSNALGTISTPATPAPEALPPTVVPDVPPLATLVASGDRACGRARESGAIYCWGGNSYGQTGRSPSASAPPSPLQTP